MEEEEFDVNDFVNSAPLITNFWDKVIEKTENFIQKKIESEEMLEKAYFIVGSSKSGKSTMIIDAFDLKDEDEPRPKVALDFFCAFHFPKDGSQQSVCNIWELSRGTKCGAVLMSIKTPLNLSAIVMLDLSSPSTLWHTAMASLDIFHRFLENKYKGKLNPQRIPESHQDKSLIQPFPIPLFFVGGKYDLFKEFEPEKKRVICQCLRVLAHINYGFLFFYSNKLKNLVRTSKDIFNHHSFGTPFGYQVQCDYSEPLLIPPGCDSFEAIEIRTDLDDTPPLEKCEKLLNTYFAQDEQTSKPYPENPRFNRNYREPKIDNLINIKTELMERFMEELKLESEDEEEEEEEDLFKRNE